MGRARNLRSGSVHDSRVTQLDPAKLFEFRSPQKMTHTSSITAYNGQSVTRNICAWHGMQVMQPYLAWYSGMFRWGRLRTVNRPCWLVGGAAVVWLSRRAVTQKVVNPSIASFEPKNSHGKLRSKIPSVSLVRWRASRMNSFGSPNRYRYCEAGRPDWQKPGKQVVWYLLDTWYLIF